MKCFSFVRRVNKYSAIASGVIIFFVGVLSTWEGVARGVFSSPTVWSIDVSRYLIIWALFLGTSSAFEEKTHISVDFIREELGNRSGPGLKRALTVCGYIFALIYVLVLTWSTIDMIMDAVRLNKLTLGTVQIRAIYLYLAMLVGSVLMIMTLIYIIIDLLRKGDRYL